MALQSTSTLLLVLMSQVFSLPSGQQGYGFRRSSFPFRGQSAYSSYPSYQATGYQTYPAYQQQYQGSQSYSNPTYNRQQSSYSQSYQQVQPYSSSQQTYPSYQQANSFSWSYPASNSYSYPSYPSKSFEQTPAYNYMINDLGYSSSSSPSSPSVVLSSLKQSSSEPQPAWQGKVGGKGATRCHDGTVLPFRARCNKVVECNGGEDEYDCDWHKRSFIPTINSVEEFQSVLKNNDKVLIEFFAPWCPACVTFLPELEKLAARTTDIPLAIYKVNTDENEELKVMFSVDTFPRVLMFTKRTGTEPRTYHKNNGLRFEPLHQWVRNQL